MEEGRKESRRMAVNVPWHTAMILDHVLILHNSKQNNIKMVKISHTMLKASGNDLYTCTSCGGTTI